MNRFLLCIALSGVLGCNPPAPPQAQAPAKPAAQNPAVKEALKTELAGLIERRRTAQNLLDELDDKGGKAIEAKDDGVLRSTQELYVTIGNKLFEIQTRINEIDDLLGTKSNFEYAPDERSSEIASIKENIAKTEKHLSDVKGEKPSNPAEQTKQDMFVKYAETKLKLSQLKLKMLD